MLKTFANYPELCMIGAVVIIVLSLGGLTCFVGEVTAAQKLEAEQNAARQCGDLCNGSYTYKSYTCLCVTNEPGN